VLLLDAAGIACLTRTASLLYEQFRKDRKAEFFNIFNHPNFGLPDNNINDALFGYSTAPFASSLGSGGANGGLNPVSNWRPALDPTGAQASSSKFFAPGLQRGEQPVSSIGTGVGLLITVGSQRAL
jgi:hypothetical protein